MQSFTKQSFSLLRAAGLLGILLVLSAGVGRAQAVFGPGLEASLTSALPGDEFTVVVTFDGDGPISSADKNALEGLGISQGIFFQSLPMAGLVGTADQIQALAGLGNVRSIWPNSELSFFNEDARDLTGVNKLINDSSLRNSMGLPFSGKGVAVVVHDSGVDGTHPDLRPVQNVQGLANPHAVDEMAPIVYLEDQDNTDISSGHGTHVAGTVAGTGQQSGGQHAGVAPGVDLIGYGSGAVLLILDALGGFDWAISNQFRYGIRVITNSWGSSGDFNPNNPVNVASLAAYKRGMTVLFAAGNAGPDEDTHNPYAAPWVISVGAGTKDAKLIDFSSRGLRGESLDFFTPDGKAWRYENEPTVVAPGVDIISTRANTGALPLLATDVDAEVLGANAAFYTHMSGTSMATPHVAGIVALMLEANPSLQPAEIKDIIARSATNMPGRESWEVGSGYVNAYAAVQMALGLREYGATRTSDWDFNAFVNLTIDRTPFSIDYNPRPELSSSANRTTFQVGADVSTVIARMGAEGPVGETGNTIYPVLIAPDGTEYSSGTTLLFPLEFSRAQVAPGQPGTWTLEIRGIQNGTGNNVVSMPETAEGSITLETVTGFSGLNDISGHPAEGFIQSAVGELILDGDAAGNFRPDDDLTRIELAQYLVFGAGIRQGDGSATFGDVSADLAPFAEAAAAFGAAMRDRDQNEAGVIQASGSFDPNGSVSRSDLAYSLVQGLGLGETAASFDGSITADFNGTRVPVTDAAGLGDRAGYVQLAIDLGLLNVSFDLSQGEFEAEPTVTARFRPAESASRGDYAVAAVRYLAQY